MNTPSLLTTMTLRRGYVGTLAALDSLPVDTDPAIRFAYERLSRAFGRAIRQRTDTTITDLTTAWGATPCIRRVLKQLAA